MLTSINSCKLQALVGYMAVVGCLVAFYLSGPEVVAAAAAVG